MLAKITAEELETLVQKAVDKKIAPDKPEKIYTTFTETAKLSRIGTTRLRAIVHDPDFQEQLDSDNGGPVYYPFNGQAYKFDYNGFAKFCRRNMNRIFNLKISEELWRWMI